MLAIDELQLIYDFDLLKSIITSDIKISYDIKEAFTYLFTHLWTDVPPFTNIDMDYDVIPYQELSSYIKLNTSKIDCAEFDDIKRFIFSFVNDMVLRIIYDKSNREIILRFLKSLLVLCEHMFRLGFYKDLEDYNNLFQKFKNFLESSLSEKAEDGYAGDGGESLDNGSDDENASISGNLALGIGGKRGNLSSYNVLELYKECKVIIIKVIISILDIQRKIKKHAIIFKVKNFLHNSIKTATAMPPNLENYIKAMSFSNRDQINNLLNSGKLVYNRFKNKDVFVKKIGTMVWKISQEEIFIQIKKNKTLLSV